MRNYYGWEGAPVTVERERVVEQFDAISVRMDDNLIRFTPDQYVGYVRREYRKLVSDGSIEPEQPVVTPQKQSEQLAALKECQKLFNLFNSVMENSDNPIEALEALEQPFEQAGALLFTALED